MREVDRMTSNDLITLGIVLCAIGLLLQLGLQPILHRLKKNLFD